MVTLGFGFKSYVSYRMRLRRQKEVAKENEFYAEILQQALPQESVVPPPPPAPCLGDQSPPILANGNVSHQLVNGTANGKKPVLVTPHKEETSKALAVVAQDREKTLPSPRLITEYDAKKTTQNGIDKHELQYMEHQIIKKISSVNDFDEENEVDDSSHKTSFKSITASLSASKTNASLSNPQAPASISTSSPSPKWNHNHSNQVNSNCLAGSAVVSNATVNSALTNSSAPAKNRTKNLVTNNLTPQKDENTLK